MNFGPKEAYLKLSEKPSQSHIWDQRITVIYKKDTNNSGKSINIARKRFVWFWVHCAKIVECIKGPEPSHLIYIV